MRPSWSLLIPNLNAQQLNNVAVVEASITATAIAKVQLAKYVREKLGEQISIFTVNPEYMKKNKQRQRHNIKS